MCWWWASRVVRCCVALSCFCVCGVGVGCIAGCCCCVCVCCCVGCCVCCCVGVCGVSVPSLGFDANLVFDFNFNFVGGGAKSVLNDIGFGPLLYGCVGQWALDPSLRIKNANNSMYPIRETFRIFIFKWQVADWCNWSPTAHKMST